MPNQVANGSAFHTDHLLQRVYNVDQVRLRGHDGIDVLVSCGRFIQDVPVLAALHPPRGCTVIGQREAALGIATAHDTARAM